MIGITISLPPHLSFWSHFPYLLTISLAWPGLGLLLSSTLQDSSEQDVGEELCNIGGDGGLRGGHGWAQGMGRR